MTPRPDSPGGAPLVVAPAAEARIAGAPSDPFRRRQENPVIAFVRVVSVKPGKQVAAMTFAKEIAAYFKSNHHVDMEVLRPIGGNPQRIAWSTRYPDMATMETLSAKYA